jgi:hypothetical protein
MTRYEPFASPTAPRADADTADHEALIAETLHWPEHWDTAAYPDVWSALQEVMHSFQCSECRLDPVDGRADPTDPGYDVSVLREQVRHLERRIRQLAAGASERADAEKDSLANVEEVYRYIIKQNGRAANRTTPENICDVFEAIAAIAGEKK